MTHDAVTCAQVLDLMAKDLEHMGQMTCEVKKARWARILDALRLSRPQQDALLLLRKQHLKKLHDVYEQRQRLNMQVRDPSWCCWVHRWQWQGRRAVLCESTKRPALDGGQLLDSHCCVWHSHVCSQDTADCLPRVRAHCRCLPGQCCAACEKTDLPPVLALCRPWG